MTRGPSPLRPSDNSFRLPARWLVFLAFVPGLWPGLFGVADPDGTLAVASVVSAVAYAVLQDGLKQPIEKTLWVWILLAVFLMGFYLKFWVISLTYDGFPEWYREMPWLTQERLNEAMAWTAFGFSVFCVVARCLLRLPVPSLEGRRMLPPGVRMNVDHFRLLIVAVIVGYVVAAALHLMLDIGHMGARANVLPFRVDTLITRTRVNLIPALFVLLLWLSDGRRPVGRWFLILTLMITVTFADSMIRASRSACLLAVIPLILLWLVSHRMTFWRRNLIVAATLLTILVYPFLTAVRVYRMGGYDLDAECVREASTSLSWGDDVDAGLNVFLAGTRVAGLDGLLHNLHSHNTPSFIEPHRLLWLFDYYDMLDYQTYEVVGISRDILDGRVPGLLGSFLLVGGKGGMAILLAAYIWLTWLVWRRLLTMPIAPVALALFGTFYFVQSAEGTHGVQIPIAWAVAIWLTSHAYRWLVSRPTPSYDRVPANARPGRLASHGVAPKTMLE